MSHSYKDINAIKSRKLNQRVLLETANLNYLKSYTRVPNILKKRLRRQEKVTFILKNKKSFRVVKDQTHLLFLEKFGMLYSSSANLSSKPFCLQWAKKMADILVIDRRGYQEKDASKIYKISEIKLRKIR